MGHHKHRRIVGTIEVLEVFQQHAGVLGIESARGLIGHNQLGICHQGTRGSHALLLAAGELEGVFIQHIRDIEARGHLLHAHERLVRRNAPDGKGQRDVLTRCKGIEQV